MRYPFNIYLIFLFYIKSQLPVIAIRIVYILFFLFFILSFSSSFSQTLTIGNNGTYSSPSSETYDGLSLGNSASLTVNSGHTLTINGNATSNNGFGITVEENATLIITGTLTGNNSITLTVSGTLSVGGISISNNGTLTVGGTGEITVNGDFTSGTGATIDIDGGMTVDGNLDLGSGSTISNDGTLSVSGEYTGPEISGGGETTLSIYSCDMETCGANWDNNEFIDGSSYSGGCDGKGLYDNVWGTGAYSVLTCFNNVAITGHTGGELTVSVKVKLRDYYSPYEDRTSTEFGNLKIYYKTSLPSVPSPGTQIGSTITSSTDCQVHSVSFSPGVTITNLYLAFVYDNEGVGDNWIIYDDVTVSEFKEAEPVSWTGSTSTAWTTASNWSSGSVPTSSSKIIIPNVTNQPVITANLTIASLTVNTGADITISSNTLTVSGVFDLNGTMYIDNATVNADGNFDATGGTIDFTNTAGKLILSSTVTSLGTLDDAMGTVEYDGATQTVLADSYFNLSIATAGTKTAGGNLDVNGNLTTAATATCKLDLGAFDLNVAGDLTVGAVDGLDASEASCLVTVDGTANQSITHSGVTGGGNPVAESAESGLGGFATSGTTLFTTTSSYNNSGSNAYINSYSSSNTNILSYNSNIDLTIATAATLTFYHIAKTEGGWDKCYVQYSENGGTDWTTFPNSKYTGSSSDYSTNVYFHEDSYATWGTTDVTPDNATWWKLETFDMSFLVGQNDIRIRFRLTSDGSVQRYGWIIDDVNITYTGGFGSELTNLTLNKASGDLILNDEITIDGALTFTSGVIDASSNNLVLTADASVSGASDASHVIGSVVKTTTSTSPFTFPVGDGTNYRAIAITPTNTSATTWRAQYNNTQYSSLDVDLSLDHVSSLEYWDLDRIAGTESAAITLSWDANSGDVITHTDLVVAHFDGTNWENAGGNSHTGNNTAGTVISNAAWDTYSPFTIGTTNPGNALPVIMTDFNGSCQTEYVHVFWQTASEMNCSHFDVERSKDGFQWEVLGSIHGNGNSTSIKSYDWLDYTSRLDVRQKPVYYRLRQVDFDGNEDLFSPISVFCDEKPETKIELYPNPTRGFTTLFVNNEKNKDESAHLILSDITGKILFQQSINLSKGGIELNLDLTDYQNGVYNITVVSSTNERINQRLIKQ